MWRLPWRRDLGHEDDRLRQGGRVFGVGMVRQHAELAHPVEDVVSAGIDLGRLRDDQLELARGTVLAGGDGDGAGWLGVLGQVEFGGRLGDRREDGGLGEAELFEREAEVGQGRRLDAVAPVAIEVLVEVGGDDLALALDAGILLGQPDRLDDLADLPLVDGVGEGLLGQEPRPDELLGDRRSAARPAVQGIDRGRDEAAEVEARVLPEVLVLRRGRRVEEVRREIVERHELAAQVAEPGALDLAGPVVDDRLLVEGEVREQGPGIVEATAVVGVRGHRAEGDDGAGEDQKAEEEEREDERRATDRGSSPGAPRRLQPPVPLAPRQAGLHVGVHDSMGE